MDDLGDDEVEPLLGEDGVEFRVDREGLEARNLTGLAGRIRGRQFVFGLETPDLLRAPEALREHVDEGRIDVVNAPSQGVQLVHRLSVHHAPNLPGHGLFGVREDGAEHGARGEQCERDKDESEGEADEDRENRQRGDEHGHPEQREHEHPADEG